MSNFKKFIIISALSLFLPAGFLWASAEVGTIDPNNLSPISGNQEATFLNTSFGALNFDCTNCNVTVKDNELIGFAWGNNVGWVNLNSSNCDSDGDGFTDQGNFSFCSVGDPVSNFGISNDSEGNLSGYAWGQNTGWISFWCGNQNPNNCSQNSDFRTTINYNQSTELSEFNGYAWAQNYGWIDFTCPGPACVETDWRPASVRPTDDGGGGGGTILILQGKLIKCLPESQSAETGDTVKFRARNYTDASSLSWKAPGGDPSAGSGSFNFSTIFNSVGTYFVTVTQKQGSSKCSVTVTETIFPPPEPIATEDVEDGVICEDPDALNFKKEGLCEYLISPPTCGILTDIDNDGFFNINNCDEPVDNCPDVSNPDQADSDGDGIGDVCDDELLSPKSCGILTDSDGDGFYDQANDCDEPVDNCSSYYNPSQTDSNNDGIGDACDEEEDEEIIEEEIKLLPPKPEGVFGDNNIPPPSDIDVSGSGIEPPSIINTITDQMGNAVDQIAETFSETISQVQNILENPTGNAVSKIIDIAGVVAGAMSIVALAFFGGVPITASELPVRLWSLLLGALGIKRMKPWGKVYDAETKQGLDPVHVVLQDQFGQESATAITSINGDYGFQVKPGKYKIIVNKTDYMAPSKKLAGRSHDEVYKDLYFGEEIEIIKQGGIITKNIPMDLINPEKRNWNEIAKQEQHLTKTYSKRERFLLKFSNMLYMIGLIVALIAILATPSPLNWVILGVYIILTIMRRVGFRVKKAGTIIDKSTGAPLPFAILRVFSAELNTEIKHVVANMAGQYYCLVPGGVTYYVQVDRKMPDGSYSQVFKSDPFKVKKGIIKNKFII